MFTGSVSLSSFYSLEIVLRSWKSVVSFYQTKLWLKWQWRHLNSQAFNICDLDAFWDLFIRFLLETGNTRVGNLPFLVRGSCFGRKRRL